MSEKNSYETYKKTKESARTNQTNGKSNNSREPGATPGNWGLAGLDVLKLFQSRQHYGKPLKDGKHAVLCPWHAEHSDDRGAMDSDTVIFDGTNGRLPGFKCQ